VLDLLLVIVLITLVCIWSYDHTDLGKYVLLGAIVLIAANDTPVAKSVFGNKPIYFIGEISYSLYLIHPLLVGASVRLIAKMAPVIGFNGAFTVALCAYLVAAIMLSVISYQILEMYFKNIILASLSRSASR
jgi:peptidoglycan/LPS O-acetylase OafA/YrhL